MREDINADFSVDTWSGLKSLSTMRGAMYVVKSNYRLMPFFNATARPYHCSNLNGLNGNKNFPKDGLSTETVQYN